MNLEKSIKSYWEVQPPYKAQGQVGTKQWSTSISEHRFACATYLKGFLDNIHLCMTNQVLEIGCGAGSDLLHFAKRSGYVYGVDITQKAVDLTRLRLKAENQQATVTKYDGYNLPFDNNTFDVVYSSGVLHHTPHTDHLLSEAYRVLRPGGRLKLMLYNRKSLLYYYSILCRPSSEFLSRDARLSKWSEYRTDCPYTKVFSEAEIKDRLIYFSKVDAEPDFFVYDDWRTATRKVQGNNFFKSYKTAHTLFRFLSKQGVELDADILDFFTDFYFMRKIGKHLLSKYGWHLLVSAIK